MTEIKFRSDMTVDLVDFMGGDDRVVQAAKVSTLGSDSLDAKGSQGFIDFLVRNKHSVPLEHSVFTFRVECPIFVSREIVKHRISSMSEISGRYTVLPGVFYRPRPERPLVQVGKTGDYQFEQGSVDQQKETAHWFETATHRSHAAYREMLFQGIAKEVARQILPVNTYTALMITLNTRSLCNFLSLRVRDETSLVPSFAMDEIEQVAVQMEDIFAAKMPLTYQAFTKYGRVSP